MLEVYLSLSDNEKKQAIIFNDAYFNTHVNGIDFDSNTIRGLISKIDETEYIGNLKIMSKMENTPTNVENLSTGCKTAINVATFQNKIVSLTECGINALEEIFKIEEGKVYIEYPMYIPYQENKKIIIFMDSKMNESSIEELDRIFLKEKQWLKSLSIH